MNKDEFLSEYAVDRRNTCCVKWDDLKESFGEDGLLPFWIADTEFKLPKQAQKALGDFRGAIVVLERDTGRVLALASSPGFDPNAFEAVNANSAQQRFEALKAWRAEVAKEHGLPAYVIFQNVTLAEMARAHPQSLDELGQVSGVGAKKLEAYGAQLLELIGAGADDGERVE